MAAMGSNCWISSRPYRVLTAVELGREPVGVKAGQTKVTLETAALAGQTGRAVIVRPRGF